MKRFGLRKTGPSRVHCTTHSIAVCSHSITDALIDPATVNTCDAILLGATQTGLFQQVMQWNIPEAVAKRSTQTVIVVRGALLECWTSIAEGWNIGMRC